MKYTTNYDQFLLINENRKINFPHVMELVRSIETTNLLEANPIIVNKNFEIIDGQHRLEACRRLSLPVPYVIVEGSIGTAIRLNTNQRNWTILDYINSYIAQGKDQYQILLDFAANYKLPLGTAGLILSGLSHNPTKEIRMGRFRIDNMKLAVEMMDLVTQIKPYVEANVMTDKHFYSVMYRLLRDKLVDPERLLQKFAICPLPFVRLSNRNAYLRQIEDVYNYKARKEARLF